MALSTDSNPRWCALDPRAGTAATVAEGVANVATVGATAKAVVNCLNFGNPEHPEVMWQLSEAVDGMGEACVALGLPVIGGNVSLYNESGGTDIDPTPVIGTLGLVDTVVAVPPSLAWGDDQAIVLLGTRNEDGAVPHHLGGSRLSVDVMGRRGGQLFSVDYEDLAKTCGLVAGLVSDAAAGKPSLLNSVHDVGSGGIAVALAESAAASGVGARVENLESVAELFTERPGRFLVTTTKLDVLFLAAKEAGVAAEVIGRTGGDTLVIEGHAEISVEVLRNRRDNAVAELLDA